MTVRNKTIYLDHAAATPLDPMVLRAMKHFLTSNFSNPSALYAPAVEAKKAIENARGLVADFLRATNDSVIFTRGGTHSVHTALLGTALKHQSHGKHIITTNIEHHAVLNTLKQLEREGFDVTYLSVDEFGFVTVDQVKQALRPDTILISIMYANNEIGTIEPIADIGRMMLQHRKKNNTRYPLLHTDACQAAGSLDMSVEKLHVDLLSFNGSKIYGPKGVGVLYRRRGADIEPMLFGGGQEFGLSPGTEDVAGIVGIGCAVSIINEQLSKNNKQISELRNYLWREMYRSIENVELNGPSIVISSEARNLSKPQILKSTKNIYKQSLYPSKDPLLVALEDTFRLTNNLNISFLGTDSEAVILYLDAKGVCVSSGSACTTDSDQMSHVLEACGYDEERLKSSIRFSFGKDTTKKEIEYVLKVLPDIIQKVRNMKEKE